MSEPFHPDIKLPGALALALFDAAAKSARLLARQVKRIRHAGSRRGTTLRPGPATPLWNELVNQAVPLLRRRGSKAQLARILGVPRQRLQDCLKSRRASLDAERTLLLLCWIAVRQQGREFAP